MEAGVARRQLLLILGLVLALRVPFLNQAIQGDDDIYLREASHALVEPLHPSHTAYVFRGELADLRGHTHPPLNAWVLAGLITLFGGVKEIPFHAAYIVFSLIAAFSMWSIARRFTANPLWATLLFLFVPAFVVNGGSLESDLPFLALWMAAIALFCADRLALAAIAMALAAMTAYQAIFLIPILAFYRRDRAALLTLLTPIAVIAGWQLFERIATGAVPAAVLSGYLTKLGLQALEAKARNGLMLFIHLWFIVFPPLALLALRKAKTLFLTAWIVIYFVCAVVAFPAGSARYLLPIAAPVAILASQLSRPWLITGFAAQMVLSLALAAVNYQHWDAYRTFLRGEPRMWVNGEWGLRHYLEEGGALPLMKSSQPRPGDWIVASDLGRSVDVTAPTALVKQMEIRPAIPLRLIGLESHSGYSTVSAGFWPFGISSSLIDRVRAVKVVERKITLEYLTMNAPDAPDHLVSGFYALEDNRFRWIGRTAAVVLKPPSSPIPLRVAFDIPASSPARTVKLSLDGREAASQTYSGPGTYVLSTPPLTGSTVTIEVDRTFSAPPDTRELGIVVTGVGFRP